MKSFKNKDMGKLNFGILEISKIFMQIESIKEGPFSVELHSVEFVFDEKYNKEYENYELPIFLRV